MELMSTAIDGPWRIRASLRMVAREIGVHEIDELVGSDASRVAGLETTMDLVDHLVRDLAADVLAMAVHPRTGDVLVAVCDSGPGLVPATLERLFEAFYTTKPGGLGMGLSICRSIIEAHGGQIWATMNVPQGAIFQFTLPAHPEDDRDLSPAPSGH